METKRMFGILLLVFLLATGFNEVAPAKEVKNTESLSTGIEDQTGVAVTIYNVNLGLVKDQRSLKLSRGMGELKFMDVASQIIPTSVHIKSLVNADSLQILEQNYEYDLLNPQKLMDKYVGKEVKLYQKNPYTEREEIVTATLLSNNGGPIFKIGDEITFGHPGRIIFPGVPESLISKPTLVWLIENSLSSLQKVEASYLTNGINWRSDYVVTLNDTDDRADLSGWVTIDNRSGTTYKDAKIKLVAGDVNRAKDEMEYKKGLMRAAEAAAKPAAQFREEEFFEYHIYTLQRQATIKDNQTKQISLVNADDIPVKKELVYYGAQYYYRSTYGEKISNQKIGVFVEIANTKDHNLGIPLPKGTVRVYEKDSEGSLQFVGEDSIDHTPKDEKVRVKLGDAFDVVGSRKQTDWKKIASDTYEAAFEISLRNHKKENVVVKVIEPIPGDWTMLSSSHEHKKTEAFTAEFNIPVEKDKETKLTYRVRMRF
ncbi:MAG TPA: DUF4139 domain-containing protein [Thermodesulfovibrionales bacterium]|nr:DUF4139 domain-containing protein [Thermodesulfovibrionales bacterium]